MCKASSRAIRAWSTPVSSLQKNLAGSFQSVKTTRCAFGMLAPASSSKAHSSQLRPGPLTSWKTTPVLRRDISQAKSSCGHCTSRRKSNRSKICTAMDRWQAWSSLQMVRSLSQLARIIHLKSLTCARAIHSSHSSTVTWWSSRRLASFPSRQMENTVL